MAVVRMDNVGIVVADLDGAINFFVEIGLELEGRADIEGEWADQTIGLQGARTEIAMLRIPDGSGRIELARYKTPAAIAGVPNPPANTLGLHRLMFAVDDIEDTVARLREKFGAEPLDAIARYEDIYKLCYLRGPEGIIVALAEQLS